MKEKDFRKDCLLTDSSVLARQTAARGLPVIYYERPGADPVYEADYTVQSLDELDELFFQRVYETALWASLVHRGDGAVENTGRVRKKMWKNCWQLFTDAEAGALAL